ncbi:hypothetical protein M3P19_15695 [Muricauda sp. 2012CJ35-5]|uniref:Nuclear transport factor 2 family protein n=1 Tax=Flagellimonas spongiicola TaxID=2942208 RepID=A0ABT0PVR4_9FLAO|nr:hypothetical protein [Allomuricauda spongiicola]MCL6275457.1 hypothetical protein [Allomuricauda spongiicola]
MKISKNPACFLSCLLLSINLFAQNQEQDRKAIDNLIDKMYKSISFIDGGSVNDTVLDAIHYSDAIIGIVDKRGIQMFNEKEFRAQNAEMFKKNKVTSFVEKELSSTTNVYGGIANRFSTYEFVIKAGEKELKIRGINSIQLVKDPEKGWLIHTTIFSDNGSFSEIPQIYLNN